MIVVNTAFEGQRTTGQQRYAQQIARRLLSEPDVVLRPEIVRSNRYAAWLDAQALMLPRRRGETLLTMTSRGPIWHPRQVIVVHDHFVLTNPEWYSRRYAVSHAALLRAQIKAARGLVFVSEWTREQHIRLFGVRQPSVVAPNGVSAPPAEQVPPSPVEGPYLLAVGSKDPRKNMDRLIAAYGTLPTSTRARCRLVLVGGEDQTVFAGTTAGPPGDASVVRLGYVTDQELWALYAGARALVLPSLAEGFGLPIIEAASLGTPLVVADLPVFRWIAGNEATYIDPLRVESIAKGLDQAITHGAPPVDEQSFRKRFAWQKSSSSILSFVRNQV